MLLKLLLCACTSSTQGARWSSVIGAIRPTGRTTIAARRRVGVAHLLRIALSLSLCSCVCFVNAGSVDYRTSAQGAQWDLWRLCMDECVDVSYLVVSNSDNRPVRVRLDDGRAYTPDVASSRLSGLRNSSHHPGMPSPASRAYCLPPIRLRACISCSHSLDLLLLCGLGAVQSRQGRRWMQLSRF